MTVVLADVDLSAVEALQGRTRRPSGRGRVRDVRDPAALTELAGRVYRDIGPVRLLVNNAGIEQFGYLQQDTR